MRPLFFLALLAACGPPPYVQPVQGDALVQGQAATPVDCAGLCERVKVQLVRDFGFTEAQVTCGSPEFWNAHDCLACQSVLRMKYGVELTECR